MRLFFCALLALALPGCRQQNRVYNKPYFDVDSLVNRQVAMLVTRHARLHKAATVGVLKDEQQWQPDSAQWAKEFEVFRQLDWMNRPGFKNGYSRTVGTDTHSNLKVITYTATRPAPVPWLKLYYLRQPGNLRKVEAHYRESNALFAAERKLTWELEDVSNQPLLTRYTVRGFQKMVSSDSVVYRIEGTINE